MKSRNFYTRIVRCMLFTCSLLLMICCTFLAQAQKVSFTADQTKGCPPFTVNFNATLDPGYSSYEWSFGVGANVSNNPAPSRIFNTPNTYPVTLTADYGGRKVSHTMDITVFRLPVVNFTVSNTQGCAPLKVDFTDRSTPGDGSIESITWSFGDGGGTTIKPPATGASYEFAGGGAFNVTSIVYNTQGCKTTSDPITIKVQEAPLPSFTADKTQSCTTPFTVNFFNTTVNNSPDPVTYVWDYGDGTTGTANTHVYTKEGKYSVTLKAVTSLGCSKPLLKQDYIVIQQIKPAFTFTPACTGEAVTFKNTTTPAPDAVTWFMPNGSLQSSPDATYTFNTPGDYTIRMQASLGICTQEVSQTVHANGAPVINPVATPQTSCKAPFTTTFQAQSSDANKWLWEFGDGQTSTQENPVHTYNTPGIYSVTLTATNANGCTKRVRLPDYIRIVRPVLTITPSAMMGCTPLPVDFTAALDITEPIVSWKWNFGDGGTSTAEKPHHEFKVQGDYTVTLQVVTASGCTADATIPIRTGNPPVVDFDARPKESCANTPIQFINLTQPKDPGMTWQWIWPDDNFSTSPEENPNHQFGHIGYHDVTLIVINRGCQVQLTKPDFVRILPPIADFNVIMNCATPYHRDFRDMSDFGPPPVSHREWFWEFGENGATSTLQHPSYDYKTTGSKTVKLTIFNGVCKSEFTRTINIIDEKPEMFPESPWVCVGKAIHLALSNMTPGNINEYIFDWGDGAIDDIPGYALNPLNGINHIYRRSGRYTVRFSIVDKNGCTRVAPDVIIDVHGPATDFDFSGLTCKNALITFTDKSTIDAGNDIVSWKWDFGDGSTPVEKTARPADATHTYTNPNSYTISLLATDKFGCQVTAQKNIRFEEVKADFLLPAVIACKDVAFTFVDQSTGTIADYTWDFGNGTTGTGTRPQTTYDKPGKYDITLKITTVNGCTDQITKTQAVTVPDPKASFTFPAKLELCPPVKVLFTNTSGDFLTSRWDFGDNSSSTKNDPDEHIYVRAGTYNVKLTVYSAGGCSSETTQPVTIQGPDGTLNATPTEGCIPLAVSITATADKAVTFQWDFDDGTVLESKTPVSPPHTYTKPGLYTPRVSLIDAQGCAVKAIGNDVIMADNAVADFTVDNAAACGGGIITFTNRSKTTSKDLRNENFTNSWNFGVTGNPANTSTTENGSFNYPRPGSYDVSLEITSRYGCKDKKILPVTVPPQPEPVIEPIPALCVSGKIQLRGHDNKNLPNTRWQWLIGSTQQYDQQTPPEIELRDLGTTPVALTITNADGSCPATTNAAAVVNPAPALNPTPLTANICAGKGLQLQANTAPGVTVSWTPYNISDATSPSPVVTPARDTEYKVVATNSFGCTKEASVKLTVTLPFKIYALDAQMCAGKNAQLLAGGALRYKWTPSAWLDRPDMPDPVANPEENITYQVVGYDDKGCFTDTARARVFVHPSPVVNAGPDMVIPVGSPVTIPAIGSPDIIKTEWTPLTGLSCTDCLTPLVTPKADTRYRVTVMNQNGCTATDEILIKTVCNEGNVFIPNSFSPNGDGQNDIFYIRGRGMQTVRVFRIYNRWGQLIFERGGFTADDPAFGWDGRFKGTLLNPDVFVYYTEIVCDKGEPVVMKGNITLIR
ncbi:PKD domain-containing protein [Chitinophaga solisilvae]|uniref:PKD domain-containing protein n=1 Tax=Chitinophaga solisilvae TaxID=1233460 RepID=UPI00136B0C09|nr:PKD domain-containing protein [Chitinophaga solisilvae]